MNQASNHHKGKSFNIKTNQDTLELNLSIVDNTEIKKKKLNYPYSDFVVMNTSNVSVFPNAKSNLHNLLINPEFSCECSKVLLTLMLYLDFDNWILLSQAEMAKEIGMQRQNFSRNMKKLENMNVIEKGRKYRNFYNYRLSPQYAWKGERESLKKNLVNIK